MRSSGMRLSPRVRGIAGLTSAITRRAVNAAARVDVDRDAEAAHAVAVRRGDLDQRHVERMRPLLKSAGTSASESGTYSNRVGARRPRMSRPT